MDYIKELNVQNVKLKNNVFLAPMAGVTDIPFRRIVREVSSPALTFTEMASSKAMEFGSEKTEKLLKIPDYEKPSAVQIFGSNKYVISETIKKLILELGSPIFMTSANQSGEPTCTSLDEIEKMCPKLDGMLEGNVIFSKGSTIIDCSADEIKILREGPITIEQINEIVNYK